MPMFRKKPMIVDAVQWYPGNDCRGVCDDHPDRTKPIKICGCTLIGGVNSGKPHVHPTRADHGVLIDPGDWIIKEQDGSGYYPCKSDIFTTSFDPM